MQQTPVTEEGIQAVRRAIEIAIRLAVVFALLWWSFRILSPFIDLLAWSGIIAVALYPVARFLAGKMGTTEKKASWLICLLLIVLIIVPTVDLALSSVDSAREAATQWKEGKIKVPAPTEKVRDWPLIGEKLYNAWLQASQNLEATAQKFSEEIKALGTKALAAIAGAGLSILKFTAALLIAAVMMGAAGSIHGFMVRLSSRLVGAEGDHFIELATKTVRSVAQGVLGIAVIQAVAAAIGLVVMDIPLAGLWALGVLMLAIVQLPPLLILVPIAALSFSTHDTVSASIFLVYCIIVSMSDSFLKPLLLGRGVDVPMLVILLGAIGGMIASGIIGLFVGAVVLALVYQLFMEWINRQSSAFESQEAGEAES